MPSGPFLYADELMDTLKAKAKHRFVSIPIVHLTALYYTQSWCLAVQPRDEDGALACTTSSIAASIATSAGFFGVICERCCTPGSQVHMKFAAAFVASY